MKGARRLTVDQTAEQEKHRRRWDSLSDWTRAQASVILNPVARVLGRLGVHPNTITVLGFLLQLGVAGLFYLSYLRLGGLLLFAVAPMDALDGAVARTVGQKSRFGAFLDSTLDRLSDTSLVLGLTAHYLRHGVGLEVGLFLLALVSVLMVSYVRARAEALGFSCKIGVLTRMERVILIGALSAAEMPALLAWTLAVLSVFTLAQRIRHVYLRSRQERASVCGTGRGAGEGSEVSVDCLE